MNRMIQPLSEEFLYASPEALPTGCYRMLRRRTVGKRQPIQSEEQKDDARKND